MRLNLVQSWAVAELMNVGCRGISVDGKLGGETCGALTLLKAKGKTHPDLEWALGSCGGKGSTYSCSETKVPLVPSTPPPASKPPATTVPKKTSSVSSSNMLMGGIVVVALGVAGYAVAKKKGWIE
jgi:hypothetical protein